MKEMNDLMLVTIGCASPEEAAKIGEALVSERLVACSNAYEVDSVYDWKNERVSTKEVQLELKTVRAHLDAIEVRVSELHSYDVPGILALPIEQANEAFAEWVRERVQSE